MPLAACFGNWDCTLSIHIQYWLYSISPVGNWYRVGSKICLQKLSVASATKINYCSRHSLVNNTQSPKADVSALGIMDKRHKTRRHNLKWHYLQWDKRHKLMHIWHKILLIIIKSPAGVLEWQLKYTYIPVLRLFIEWTVYRIFCLSLKSKFLSPKNSPKNPESEYTRMHGVFVRA